MLIGIVGKKGSGKDTSADYLINKYNFIKKSFADPLKKACKELFLLSDEQLYGTEKEMPDNRWYNCSPRTMLQYVGTDLLRNQLNVIMPGLDNNIFINHFKLWYNKEKNSNTYIVIPDVRFLNEVNIIKELNGIIIKIERNNNNDDMHISEKEMEQITSFDYIINNNSTKDDLYKKIDLLIMELNI